MPRNLSPEASEVLSLLKKTKSTVWDNISPERDEAIALMRDAVWRATALERKQIPITTEEKVGAFKLMGFDPTEKQMEIACDRHRVRIVRAGRRSGKTTLAAHEAVAVMVSKPGSFGWVVAPDYDLTYRCWEEIVKELDKLEARGLIKYKNKSNTRTSMRIVLDNGSSCEGQSCENADDLQGVGLDWLVCDEIAQILPFVFFEMLFPALADRGGWAFLIGTPIGTNWTEHAYREQVRKCELEGIACDWSEHMFETWLNTKMFPGGRNDPKIKDMERTMSFEEFMEQVCAQPQKSRYVTYKEFNPDVHVRACAFNPRYPVQISIDPSTGVNPYGVAVFQDLGSVVLQIDEYYKMSVTFADVIEDLRRRPWWDYVEEAIIDDSWPQERESWRRNQNVHFSVRKSGKSSVITDSIPTVKAWLRDPIKWNNIILPIRDEISQERFKEDFYALEFRDQNTVMIDTEYRVSKDLNALIDCARFFVDRRCHNTIDEFSGYMYKRRKRDDQNPAENPTQHKDHMMDAIRYFLHFRKRRWNDVLADIPKPYSYLMES
jgi:hypothetical protein